MDGGNTTDVNSGADDSGDVARIPLLLEFDEPETVTEPLIADNDLPEAELEIGTHEEPAQEVSATMPSADLPVANVVAVRLGSGADDDLSSATEADAEAENMDRRGSRRRRGRRHRSRRSRDRRHRSRRSRDRRSRSRSRRSRSRSRRGRSRGDWSGSEDSEMTVVVEIVDDDVSTERAADGSRGGRKASRGRGGGRGRKAGGRRGVAKRAATRGARKSAKRGRRGRKTAGGEPARRTLWTDRLRSRKTRRQQKVGRSK